MNLKVVFALLAVLAAALFPAGCASMPSPEKFRQDAEEGFQKGMAEVPDYKPSVKAGILEVVDVKNDDGSPRADQGALVNINKALLTTGLFERVVVRGNLKEGEKPDAVLVISKLESGSDSKTSMSPLTFVPIVGLFAGGASMTCKAKYDITFSVRAGDKEAKDKACANPEEDSLSGGSGDIGTNRGIVSGRQAKKLANLMAPEIEAVLKAAGVGKAVGQ